MEGSLKPEGENPSMDNFLNICKLVCTGLICGSCDKDVQVNKKRGREKWRYIERPFLIT